MANLKLIGAVAIKVRPDTSAFRHETQSQLDRDLGRNGERAKAKVKVEPEMDTTQVKRKWKTLEEEMDGKTFKLNVGLDHDSVQKAKEQIDRSLNSLKNHVIPFELKRESLLEAKRELKKLEENATVDFKFVRDEAGYQSILTKIKRIREQKGLTSTWKFKTDTKSLREAELKAKAGLARIEANKTITLSYANTYEGIKGAIAEVDKRLAALRELKLKTKLDAKSLTETKTKLLETLRTAPVTVKFNEDKPGYEQVLSRIKQIQRERVAVEITFDTDDASLEAKRKEIQAKLDALTANSRAIKFTTSLELDRLSVEEAEREAKKLNDKISHMKASMKVELAGSELTAARMKFLGRDRVVNYFARVNTSSVAIAEGILKSLGGINTLSSLGKGLESLFTKFDTLTLKIGGVATALGSVSSAGFYAFTSAFKIGEGIGQSLGLLAAAPAILGAATAGYTIFTAAFNNFFDAFNKDPKIAASSLAALPPIARKTVDSITGLYKGLANPIQEKFWAHVGTTLSDSIETLYPKLKSSLLNSTEAVGDFVAGIGKSMNKLALSKDFDKMFAGFDGFFKNLSGASEPFFDGWNKFGVQGAQLLPMFGTWITKMAVRFDEWATKLSANGGINDMIMHGVNSLQAMWAVGGDVVDIFKGITKAAGLAGTGGLAQFEINLRKVADRMNSEPWQSRAATIFEGARKGATGLNVGFKDLNQTLGASAIWLGGVLQILGEIGGESLSRLSDVFSTKEYQNGVTAELIGMKDLVGELGPSFVNLGVIVGNMGRVAGSVFSGLGPVINQVVGLIATVTSNLAAGLADVAPKMLATVGGIFRVIAPPIEGLSKMIAGLLDIVGRVPDSFVLMGVAASAFFALRGLSSKFFESLSGTKTFKNLETNWMTQQAAAGKTIEKWKMVDGVMQKITVPTEKYNAFKATLGAVTSQTDNMRSRFREANEAAKMQGLSVLEQRAAGAAAALKGPLLTGIKGLYEVLGGGFGIAIMGASLLIGAFAQANANAKQHVDDLTASIDRQTGQLNQAGLEKIAKSWSDIKDAGDGFANLTRGAQAANETAADLGLNMATVTKTIANGGAPAQELVGNLTNLADSMKALNVGSTSGSHLLGTAVDDLSEAQKNADKAAAAFGLTTDQLDKMGLKEADVRRLADNVRDEANAAAIAKQMYQGLGDAAGTTGIKAEQMAKAMQTIGDNSIDAAGKIGAINKALDLLKGGSVSAREAEVNANANFQNAISQAQAIKEQLAGNMHLIDQTTGLIDTTSESGLKLQQTMSGQANTIKIAAMAAAQAAKDAGGSAADQAAASQKVLDQHAGDLEAIAKAAGVSVEDIQAEWDGFFGKKWQLDAVFTASAQQVQDAAKVVTDAGLAWDQSVWEAMLKANPNPATWSTDQARQWATDYANGQYKAQLDALNPAALAAILQATGQADNYKDGNYTAVMKAWNSTDPGVRAAIENIKGNLTGKDWQALVKVLEDSIYNTYSLQRKIDNLKGKQVSVGIDIGPMTGNARTLAMLGMSSANGSITAGDGSYPGRFMPQVRAFANGGLNGISVEKPGAAKIYSPASQYRIFAEPTTGGEAYIPMAASKRGRSTAILAEVAKQFGLGLTKAQTFANGGVVTGGNSNAARGLQVHIGTYNQNAQDTVDDVARGIMRQARSAGVTGILDGI